MNFPEQGRGLLQETPERQAQLVAAAEALVRWVHARRVEWDTESPEMAEPALPAVSVLSVLDELPPIDDLPSVDDVVWSPPSAGSTPAAIPLEADSIEELIRRRTGSTEKAIRLQPDPPGPPRARFRLPMAAIGSLAAPVLRSALRAGRVAAILALIVAAGWLARPYIPELLTRFSKLTTTPKTGIAVLESEPTGSELLIDGKASGTTPLAIELPTGRHVVEFRRRNASRRVEIDVPGGGSTTGRVDWNAVQTGRFMARSDPPGARVVIDGRPRGTTPLTLEDLSVGSHVVVLESDQGSVRRTVQVTSEGTALVSESIYAGWLKLFVPFPVEITEGSRVLRLDEQNQIMMAPGVHELQFQSRALGYRETRRVEVNPGQSTALSLVPSPSTLYVTASLPAAVLIDGERVGETPLADWPIALGTREIVVRSTTGAERRYTRQVTVAPLRIEVDFSTP